MKKYEKDEFVRELKNISIEFIKELKKQKFYVVVLTIFAVYTLLGLIFDFKNYILLAIIFFVACPLLFFIAAFRIIFKEYYKSDYYKALRYPAIFTFTTKGNIGEYETSRKMKEFDPDAKILFDVYIPKSDGITSQIDLLCISKNGIYVIESKNISGTIYGSENDKFWTIVYNNGYKKIDYFNPIKQNKKHTEAIINLYSNLSNKIYKQYVVLSERCKIGKMNINSENVYVIKRNKLLEHLKEKQNEEHTKLTKNEINMLYNELLKYQKVPKKIKKKHDEYLSSFRKF